MRRLATVYLAFIMLVGCAALGVPQLKSFGDRLAAGYTTVTGARQFNTTLLNGQRISSSDAENVQKQLDAAREGLDVASTLTGLDAENKLQSTLAIANAALGYLCQKNPADANCQNRSQP
jgi:hypothetical protein